MPALPNVPSTIRTNLNSTLYTAPIQTRFYTQYTGTAPTSTQLATFNAALATAFSSDLKSLVDVATTLVEIESIDLTSPTAAVAVTSESIVGTRSGNEYPNQVCCVTSYKVARRYRGGHPRGYWRMGVSGDESTGRQFGSTFLTAVHTGLTNFMTAVAAAGWSGAGTLSQVNVSYYKGFTVVTSPTTGRARNVPTLRATPVIDAVTSIVVQPSIGTQRRREEFVD